MFSEDRTPPPSTTSASAGGANGDTGVSPAPFEPPTSAPPWPAIVAWGAVASGIALSRQFPVVTPFEWWSEALLFALLATALRRPRAMPALVIAALALSAGFTAWRLTAGPTPALARSIAELDRAIVTVEGHLVDLPEVGSPTPGAFSRFLALPLVTRFTLDVDTLRDANGPRDFRACLWVRVGEALPPSGSASRLRAGDRVRIDGILTPIAPAGNPGQIDPRLLAAERGVVGRLSAARAGNITRLDPDRAPRAFLLALLRRMRADLRDHALRTLRNASGDHSPEHLSENLIATLLLGAREDGAVRELSTTMRRLGVAHVLAISGLHLGIVLLLGRLALRGVRARPVVRASILAAIVLLYLMIVPVRAPILRAGVIALVFLAAEMFGRRYHPIALLAYTGVGLLFMQPLDLYSPGYQLSFGVVAAIIVFPPIVARRLHPTGTDRDAMTRTDHIFTRLESAIIVSVAAWMIATPIIVHHFGVFSLWTVPVTIALTPVIVVALAAGIATLLVASLAPALAPFFGQINAAVSDVMEFVVGVFDNLPLASNSLPPVNILWTGAAVAIASWWLARGSWRSRRDLAMWAALALWLGWFAAAPRLFDRAPLRIDTLDVNDGACHIIRSGGRAILWDAGSRHLWMGERELPRAIRALGAWPVRTIILTHPNLDHYSAIPDLIDPLGVREVLVAQAVLEARDAHPNGPVRYLLDTLAQRGVRVRLVAAGDSITLGDARLDFLHPPPDEYWPIDNDSSLVALVRVPTERGVRSALFTGDIERGAIERIMRDHFPMAGRDASPTVRFTVMAPGKPATATRLTRGTPVPPSTPPPTRLPSPDIMEAPHHGSAEPAAIDMVKRLNPQFVLQSTGPTRANDDRWREAHRGRTWLTTALDGAVTITIERDGSICASTVRRGFISAQQ